MTIYNMLNAHERPNLDEVNNEPSMTVPDEAMSLREILYRFAQGQELPIAHELPYHDEDELELHQVATSILLTYPKSKT